MRLTTDGEKAPPSRPLPRWLRRVAALVLIALAGGLSLDAARGQESAGRRAPNIVLIMVDDK